jgi:hypothetical protein
MLPEEPETYPQVPSGAAISPWTCRIRRSSMLGGIVGAGPTACCVLMRPHIAVGAGASKASAEMRATKSATM